MSVDRPKVLAAAQKYLSKGEHDRAIAEYRKLVEADASDVRTWLKIGDLYTRKGNHLEASRTYERVAEHYAGQGFFLKAVAVFKQIIKLEPQRLDISTRLAAMYENLQLISDALTIYEQIAGVHARAGDMEKMLAMLQRMAELDPDNIPIRIRNAEALSKAGQIDSAAREFEAGAGLLEAQGRTDDYLKVAERLLYHRPEDTALALTLADVYLKRDDPKRALGKLQICFKKDPKNAETLELLARAFHVLGQTPKTISVYRELARVFQEKGRFEDRARILGEILRLDPADGEARQALAAYAPAIDDEPELEVVMDADAELEIVDDDDLQVEVDDDGLQVEVEVGDDGFQVEVDDDGAELELIEADEDDIVLLDGDDEVEFIDSILPEPVQRAAFGIPSNPAEQPSFPTQRPSIPALGTPSNPADRPVSGRPSIPPDIAREAQIARLLTECEVFERYGVTEKVIRQLQQVIEIAPHHVEAREKLKDTLLAAGDSDAAIAELYALADRYEKSNPQVSTSYRRQADKLANDSVDSDASKHPIEEHAVDVDVDVIEDVDITDDDESEAVLFMDDEPEPVLEAEFSPSSHQEHVPNLDPVLDMELPAPPPGTHAPRAAMPTTPTIKRKSTPANSGADAPVPRLGKDLASIGDEFAEDEHTIVTQNLDDIEALLASPVSTPEAFVAELDLPQMPSAPLVPGGSPAAPLELPNRVDEALAQSEREAIQRNSSPPGEIEEILDEVDFYIAQGLWDAGAGTLQEALTSLPQHPVLLDKLQQIEEGRAASESVAPDPVEDDAFALAERLAEEIGPPIADDSGSDVLDVEQVFEQFKRGVQEQVSADDSDTHFDLGIAYKEMGLLDDAISEFELAMKNPSRETLCHTMVGLCRVEQGRVSEAIDNFKKGLYVEQKTAAEELGLNYELAVAYQTLDDLEEATFYFEKVLGWDPKFRDAAERMDRIGTKAGSLALELDDFDAAFDDLLGDD